MRSAQMQHSDDGRGNGGDHDKRPASGLVCPRCKCRYGHLVSVELATQRTTVRRSVCGYRWFEENPDASDK
jgi:hypothetical protein